MSSSARSSIRLPFTASQWQELENQALVYKYMISGIPIPPDLLYSIRRSLDPSISSKLHIGWKSFQMGLGRKIDPEPGRCRRTDGKKWRCSKDAYPDSKYCERHMHRGRNRSRKPVEINLSPNGVHINSDKNTSIINNKNNPSSSDYLGASSGPSNQTHFLSYPYFSSSRVSRPPGSSSFSLSSPQDYRNSSYIGNGMKREIGDEHSCAFFAEGNHSNSSSNDSCWKMAPLTMGSSQMKHSFAAAAYNNSSDGQRIHQRQQNHQEHYLEREHDYNKPEKVMHHFLDEYPPKDKDSHEDKIMSSHRTQLSIAIPNSMHDFFMTQKW